MIPTPAAESRQTPQPVRWVVIGMGLIWLAFHLWTLVRYPTVTCDEAFYGRSALAYADGLGSSPDWPHTGLNFYLPYGRLYWLLLGGALNLLGSSVFAARLTSLIGWVALIAATYWLGLRYSTRRTALWSAMLIATAWIPLLAAHRARPDIWAAAAGAACLALKHVVEERASFRLYLLLGVALALQLAIHPIVIYLTAGLMLSVGIHAVRQKKGTCFTVLVLAFAVTTAVMVWVRLGGAMPLLMDQFVSDPGGALRSYNLAGAAGSGNLLAGLAGAGGWLAGFWWRSYAWLAPIVSLPQAVLFFSGQMYALFSSSERLRHLGQITLVSLLLFGVINAGYTAPPGYALQWMPAYFVMGIDALWELGRGLSALSARREWATLAVGALVLIYAVGTGWLIFSQPPDEYRRVAGAIQRQLQPGELVLASPIWWFALHGGAELVDEGRLAPEHTILWWNSMPDGDVIAGTHSLEPLVPLTVEGTGADLIEQAFTGPLGIEVAIGDGAFACLDQDAALSQALTAVLNSTCIPQTEIASVSYGMQTIYQCAGQMESKH